MRKSVITLVLLCVLFLTCYKRADASIVTIGKTGEVKVNVLAAENVSGTEDVESVKIAKSAIEMGEADMPVSLSRSNGKYMLSVAGKDGERNFDVSDYKDRILEIEERPSVKKIGISLSNNKFVIEQRGIRATTQYQINIEPKASRITVLTPTGYKFLTTLPSDALNILLKSKSISSLGENGTVEITEDYNGNLIYQVNGIKRVGIKDLYMHDVPVSAKLLAGNGQVLEVDQPVWLKILSLFEVQS